MSLRNVIYYNAGNDKIALGVGISNLPYTDVIVANIQPASPTDRSLKGYGNAFDPNLRNNVQTLQRANKNVLVSFGGANNDWLTTAAYQYYASNVPYLVSQIVGAVNAFNFNGVDIDYEDDAGFGNNAVYDGVQFLSALTSQLAQQLPSGRNIITHAPQTPYWDSHSNLARDGVHAPYVQIWQNVGTHIAWINNQFYNNSTYDATAALKVQKYKDIAGLIPPQQLLMGVSLNTAKNGDEGAVTLDDMASVIQPLKTQLGSNFGGVVGWQFSLDQGGAWANGIWQQLTSDFGTG